jgi:hypothetical protein
VSSRLDGRGKWQADERQQNTDHGRELQGSAHDHLPAGRSRDREPPEDREAGTAADEPDAG